MSVPSDAVLNIDNYELDMKEDGSFTLTRLKPRTIMAVGTASSLKEVLIRCYEAGYIDGHVDGSEELKKQLRAILGLYSNP